MVPTMTEATDPRMTDLEARVRVLEQVVGAAGTVLAGVLAQAGAERPVQPEQASSGKGLGDVPREELHELCEQHGIPDATRTKKKDLIAALRAKGVSG
jgi:Rho termination factor, N-terminal domain